MALTSELIRKMTISARTEGVDEAITKTTALASSGNLVVVSFNKAESATLSSEKAYQKLVRQLDQNVRAQDQYAKALKTIEAAEAQGLVTRERGVQLMEMARAQYSKTADAASKMVSAMSAIGKATLDNNVATQSMIKGMSDFGKAAEQGGNAAANGSKLARHELVNLGRQIQDVGVSLQAGQSPFTVLVQQGAQIADVFISSKASVSDFFAQFAGWVRTPAAAIGGLVTAIAAIGVTAVAAALKFGESQQAIRQALAGVGAASGATIESINKIAEASSSSFGLSISEAREFATVLASTGKVGVEQIGKLTALGKDFARAFGTDTTAAAKRLADIMSGDLAKGAEELAQRVGTFDAAIVNNIRNLQAQGDRMQAQALLTDTLAKAMQGQQAILTTSTAFWTTLGNAISNAFDKFGQWASKSTGIGFVEGLDDQIERVSTRIAELQDRMQDARAMRTGGKQMTQELADLTAQLIKLNLEWEANKQKVTAAKAAQDSFKVKEAIDVQMPELVKRESLNNAVTALERMKAEVESGKITIESTGRTWDQLVTSINRAKAAASGFQTPIQALKQDSELAIKAAQALGPTAKANIAYQQEYNSLIRSGHEEVDAQMVAENRRKAVIAQSNTELGEAAKARKLSSDQAIESQKLELSLIGKNVGEQAKLRANLAAKHQVESAASAANVEADQNEIKALQEQNNQLENITNKKEQIELINQSIANFATTFVNAMLDGSNATQALSKSLDQLGRSLVQVGFDKLAKQLGSSISDFIGSSLGSIAGSFGGPLATLGIGLGASLISKLFGSGDDAEAKKQQSAQQKAADELERAKEAWAGMSGEVEAFNRAAAGFTLGELTKEIQSLFEQAAPLLRAARAANDAIGSAEISATLAAGLDRLLREFATDLPFLIAEFGKTGPLAEAKAQVKALMDAFRDLNQSITEFATRTVSDQTQAFNDLNLAAVTAVLALLDVSPPLSEIAKKVTDLTAKAGPMVDALVELGISAEDAAAAVQDKLVAALALLREGFLDELQKQINELSGGAWINQADELMDKVAQMRSDAAALGAATELIDRFYILSAQKIIDENQLAGESFDQLVAQLGLGEAGLKQFEEAVEDVTDTIVRSVEEIANAIQNNEDRLFNALHRSDSLADQLARFDLAAQREREAEVKAGGEALASLERALAQERLNIIIDFNAKLLEEQKAAAEAAAEEAKRAADEALAAAQKAADDQRRALEEATNFLTGALQNIANWIQHFLAGADSPLPPSQQLASAQASFASQKALAIGGNRDALQGLTGNAQDVVDSARRYYGSSAAGQAIIANIISQLQGLPAQVSAEQFIVDGLTEPIDNVADTVEDATALQTAALIAQLNALQLALQSGDAAAVAAALLPLFDRLDTNLNGLLDFNEFRAGLSGMASDFALRDMFTRLDTDNSGSLSKLELMAQASQNLGPINQNTDEIAFNTFQALSLQYDQGVLVNTSAIAQGVNQSNAVLSTISGTLSSILSFQQPQLTVASQSDNRLTNINGFIGTIASWSPGSNHAMGGYITGGVSGRDSVHGMLTPGEFVVREPIARNNSWLADFNSTGQMPHMRTPYASNDNGPVIFALGKMERALLLGIKALIETQLQSAGIIARPIEEANKLQRTRRGEKKVA